MGYISYYYDMMYIEHLLGRPLHIQVAPCRCLSVHSFSLVWVAWTLAKSGSLTHCYQMMKT